MVDVIGKFQRLMFCLFSDRVSVERLDLLDLLVLLDLL